ncbi:MAG: glycosyltransferase family 4 protein [Rhodospirillales bacterium]|nr:glycosyltransferase family 4 protein [Rhodospirillales bacterium]
MTNPVAFVLKGYPRLSETFIAQEILGLEQRGLDIRLFSMRRPTDPTIHPIHREIRAPVAYLPEYLHDEPLRVLRAWRAVRRRRGYASARAAFLRDLARDPSRNRLRRFGQAMVLAAELPGDVGWLHAHFLHTPASVTRYAARMTGLPWSASAHAKDVWTTPEWDKREKLADCRWLVTCTRLNAEHLGALAPARGHVELLYHGLDLVRFARPDGRRPARDGKDQNDPVIVLSVGRLVEKKGYAVLLAALAHLPDDLAWRFVHIGGGPLANLLVAQAIRLGIADRIDWRGAQPQDVVLGAYRAADLFALACRVADDGDRDGLPNVLMEAQSQGLACVATTISAIPELIDTDETGCLVSPDDPIALALAIERLIRFPDLRARIGSAGRRVVSTRFSFDRGVERLARRFGVGASTADARAMPAMDACE